MENTKTRNTQAEKVRQAKRDETAFKLAVAMDAWFALQLSARGIQQ